LLSSQECVSEQDNKSVIEDARQRQAVRLVKDFIEGAKEVQSMRKPSWDEPRPPAIACNIVWLAISFVSACKEKTGDGGGFFVVGAF